MLAEMGFSPKKKTFIYILFFKAFSMRSQTLCFNSGTSFTVNPSTGSSSRKTALQTPGVKDKTDL